MVLIDSHLHLTLNHFSANRLIKYLDRERLDCCWLLTWDEMNPGPWYYLDLPVQAVFEVYQRYPTRLIPFFAPDPHRLGAPESLAVWRDRGIRGCGELKTTLSWDSEGVGDLLKKADELRLPVLFHMEEREQRSIPYSDAFYDRLLFAMLHTERASFKIPRSILRVIVNGLRPLKMRTNSYVFPGYLMDFISLEARLRQYPAVNFVAHGPMFWRHMIDHAGPGSIGQGPDQPVSRGIIWRLLEDYPNLFADTSGFSGFSALSSHPEFARVFLSMFENKILFGIDNCLLHQKDFLDSLGLSKSTYQKLYGGNAQRLAPLS